MKLTDNFDDYIENNKKISLHPKLNLLYNTFDNNISDLNNVIFYGPSGSGKYTQALSFIQKFSPSKLTYEKKLLITYNKCDYMIKISDIHFEIDMSILGCISKLLWNDIYHQIIDILMARTIKTGIILCKNFHDIHNELLEIFYSYMQKNFKNINLKFIIISEHISFIPDNIINVCEIINVNKPTNSSIKKCLSLKKIDNISNNNNLKNLTNNIDELSNVNTNILNKIYNYIINNKQTFNVLEFRDHLYEAFIYDININTLIWELLEKLIINKQLNECYINVLLVESFNFYQLYNNNYRAIYHLENYLLKLIPYLN